MTEKSINDIEAFLANNSLETVFQYCNSLITNPSQENIEELRMFLLVKDHSLSGKLSVPKYVSRLFILLERDGFQILEGLVKLAPGSIYPTSILSTIHAISQALSL